MKLIKLNTVVASALLLLSSVDTHAQTDYIYKNFQKISKKNKKKFKN